MQNLTEQEIERGNKTISFYMNQKETLQHNTSLDLLFPVITKIYKEEEYVTVFYGTNCIMKEKNSFKGKEENDLPTFQNSCKYPEQLVEAVWLTIVQFISYKIYQEEAIKLSNKIN